MISIRKRKKELKKIYAESLMKGTINNHYMFGSRNGTLMFYRNAYSTKDGYYGGGKRKIYRHILEITKSFYDSYSGEYDSYDISNSLVKENKKIKYKGKIKWGGLNFFYYDC